MRPPDRELTLRLTGNMERYTWSINGTPFHSAEPLRFRKGERVRVQFVNETMMTHPMHLHGMWMLLENGRGQHRPAKHVIMVTPGNSVSAEIEFDAEGHWPLHCHLMFHMHAGMMRRVIVEADEGQMRPAVAYSGQQTAERYEPSMEPKAPLFHALELHLEYRNGTENHLTYEGHVSLGNDNWRVEGFAEGEYEDLAEHGAREWEIHYTRPVSEFWDFQVGLYHGHDHTLDQANLLLGLAGTATNFVETAFRLFITPNGDLLGRLDLEHTRLITQRLALQPIGRINFSSDTGDLLSSELHLRLRYEITREFAPFIGLRAENTWGKRARLLQSRGESISDFALLAGFALHF